MTEAEKLTETYTDRQRLTETERQTVTDRERQRQTMTGRFLASHLVAMVVVPVAATELRQRTQ